ncbi:MAG TPA: hypothetical protein VNI83_08245, partial [Vicinamibacterales bacterium]|nr:hypothetical protein [Vicinamibacterales bacterium]
MRSFVTLLLISLAAACGTRQEAFDVPTGSQVTIETRDGRTVAGRLDDVGSDSVVVRHPDGTTTRVPRQDIRALRAAPAPAAERPAASPDRSEAARSDAKPGPLDRLLAREPE